MRMRTFTVAGSTLAATLALTAGPTPAHASSGETTWKYVTHPVVVPSDIQATTPAALPTPTQCLATYGLACNTVDSERAAYNVPATIDGVPAGTGETIAIVDVTGSPTAQADVDAFSAAMGIPSTKLNISYPTGKVNWTGSAAQQNWALETSLDVQWAHAMAPGATIDLVIANNARGDVVNQAIESALDMHPDTLSMSFANWEADRKGISGNNFQFKQAEKLFAEAADHGVSAFASSGDWGSDNTLGSSNFDYPASDPNVAAVGGTNLYKNVDPTQPAETTWGDYSSCPFTCDYGPIGATGGAPSLLTDKQGSDISLNASVYTSVLVFTSYTGSQSISFVGGTSSSAPQWAGITADLDQAAGRNLGNIRPLLSDWADAGALYDVTQGDNTSPTFTGGYSAGTGWDIPTGYGTPDVAKLISLVD